MKMSWWGILQWHTCRQTLSDPCLCSDSAVVYGISEAAVSVCGYVCESVCKRHVRVFARDREHARKAMEAGAEGGGGGGG